MKDNATYILVGAVTFLLIASIICWAIEDNECKKQNGILVRGVISLECVRGSR